MYQKLWSDDVQYLRYVAGQTNSGTDGKSDIEVVATPKKQCIRLAMKSTG